MTKFTKEQAKEYYAKKKADFLLALKQYQGKLADDFVCYNAFTDHRYSGNNHCYIASQGGEAGGYGGFKDWANHGYKIKKGAKAIYIMQPIVKENKADDGSIETEMVNVSFSAIFHHSQVEPKPQ